MNNTSRQLILRVPTIDESIVLLLNIPGYLIRIFVLELRNLLAHIPLQMSLEPRTYRGRLFIIHDPAAEFEFGDAGDVGHVLGDVVDGLRRLFVDEVDGRAFLVEALQVPVGHVLDHAVVVLVEFDVDYFVQTFGSFPVQVVVFVPYLEGGRSDY